MNRKWFLSSLLFAGLISIPSCANESTDSLMTAASSQKTDKATDTSSSMPKGHDEDYHLVLASPESEKAFLEGAVRSYLDSQGWTKVTFEIREITTADIGRKISDWENGPELFAFNSENAGRLLSAGALSAEDGKVFSSGQTLSGDVSGRRMAYPYSVGSGYFLYYDKSLFVGREEKLESVEGILEVCSEEGRDFCYPLGDAFYSMALLQSFGARVESTWNENTKGFTVSSAFSTEAGLLGAKAMSRLVQDSGIYATEFTAAPTSFNDIGAVVDGSWSAQRFAQSVGEDNLGACPMPSLFLDGKETPLKSFVSYRMYGINVLPSGKDEKRLSLLHALAGHLSSEEIQKDRYRECGLLPLTVETGEALGISEGTANWALLRQAEDAIVQGIVPEGFWEAPASLYGRLSSGEVLGEEDLREELEKIDSLLV